MTKLNQTLAVERTLKGSVVGEVTRLHRDVQKPDLLGGVSRTYQPRDDDGDQLPSESKRVQIKANDVLRRVQDIMTELFDVTATKDVGNTIARANVVVDGVTLLEQVPTTYLLWLEHQLKDVHTFVRKLPVLDPADEWNYDTARGVYTTAVVKSTKSKKVPRNHVKAPATDKHPAQVEVYYEDVIVGDWSTTKFSGALPADRVAELVKRVEKLQRAVKSAREEANTTVVEERHVGAAIFGYLFAE